MKHFFILWLSNWGSYYSCNTNVSFSPLQRPFCGGRVKETQVAHRDSFCTGPWCTHWGRHCSFSTGALLDMWPAHNQSNNKSGMLLFCVLYWQISPMLMTKKIKNMCAGVQSSEQVSNQTVLLLSNRIKGLWFLLKSPTKPIKWNYSDIGNGNKTKSA